MADDQNAPYPTRQTSRGGPGPHPTRHTSRGDPGSDGILLEVCVECGKEYMSEPGEAGGRLRCERCGGEVFRSFDAATTEDEAEADFHASTDRDTAPDDGPTDVTRGDLADLGNL